MRFLLLFEQALVRNLACCAASTLSYRKPGHWRDAVSGFSQRIEGLAQSKSERAHDARRSHRDTGSDAVFIPRAGFEHFFEKTLACDFYCFLNRSILLVGRNGNGSLEVGGLSVEFIQWRFEIR
jgi:hypothetical protein